MERNLKNETFLNQQLFLFIRDTYTEREPGETPNDRNDRAIRVCARWYNQHLQKQGIQIQTVLLTDDAGNKSKAIEEKIPVQTSEKTKIKHFQF